jgi:hypothetical protein
MAGVEAIWNSEDSTHEERLLSLFENARVQTHNTHQTTAATR